MGTRSFADVPPTAATIALNAYIFGYGGHSLVTPHAALKQLWWTDKRIDAKVTRSFVISKLRGEERGFLDRPLAFGEGLTDDTYMEWILERAKRLFLILAEIGVPDQIFGCIDDSWDDDDLPVSLENVKYLELAYDDDEALNRKFYDTQFVYLLRELKQGTHIDYGANEHIPMEYVNTLPPAVSLQVWDRVHFPGKPNEIYMRRKFPLTDKDAGHKYRDSFMRDVRKARMFRHEHVANIWASYTSKEAGYILSDFVGEHTLGTFIDHRTPMQFVRIAVPDRPVLLCEWMHCLTDALASLHYRGTAHGAIRPSNVIIDHENRIAFSDVGTLKTFQRGKKPPKTEAYDYAAPESRISQMPVMVPSSPPTSYIDPNTLRDLPQPTPEMSDVYSLACVFLDIITFMLRGKLNDFVKFRATRVPVPYNRTKSRLDRSFQYNSEKVEAWMKALQEDSERRPEQIFRGIPDLLALLRRMLAQNAFLRPTAMEVRDRLQLILVDQCGIESLCCAGREWETIVLPDEDISVGGPVQDSFSIAAEGSSASSQENRGVRSESGCDNRRSITSKVESRFLNSVSRRRSSASSATAKLSTWRKAFVRSG
ncbi:hypothetical protein M433DRAFT_109631 [Acidomyces richmondensis BFW]|nr:MAG: hypothetical protein FE78DRAFT_170370 [Acidomyces sp. 'richmondensis']KYG44708.1 hypothetical protein M433DRAFT_109631 [Acidomyces richmondensis BFW]